MAQNLLLPRPERAHELAALVVLDRLGAPSAPRIIVAGGPCAGKTTLAAAIRGDRKVRGSDELRDLDWSASSLAASEWFDEPGPWVFEGVVMPRALRKWLARNPEGKPADLIVWINQPVVERSKGQHTMALGCNTVWREIAPELHKRGQDILEA